MQLAAVYGGAPMYRQIQQLRRGVDVIIATPGRLQDLINQGEATLAEVVVTVLDEADFMADLGFLPVVKELLDQTDRNAQRLLFSATLDGEVDSLVRRYLKDPARHEVVRPGGEAPPAEHLAFSLAFRDKLQVATELAGRPGRTIVFARTQLGVDRLAENLKAAGIKAEAIHGGLPQAARKRALEEFTDARSPVLVATDVAARGIHVDDVSLVLHYDPPTDAKTYLHRSGRTARAGAAGVVVSLLLPDQVGQAKRRFRQAKVDPAVDRIRPGDAPITDLVAKGVAVEPKERTQRDMRRGRRWPRRASASRRRPSRRLPWRPAPLLRRQAASGRRALLAVRTASAPRASVLRRPGPPLRRAAQPPRATAAETCTTKRPVPDLPGPAALVRVSPQVRAVRLEARVPCLSRGRPALRRPGVRPRPRRAQRRRLLRPERRAGLALAAGGGPAQRRRGREQLLHPRQPGVLGEVAHALDRLSSARWSTSPPAPSATSASTSESSVRS